MQLKSPDLVIAETFRVFKIVTWKESVIQGDGAGWCVADTKAHFERYVSSGNLWYLHKKSGGKWRPWLSVYKSFTTGDFEIAKRGNYHTPAHTIVKDYSELRDWFVEIGAAVDPPKTALDEAIEERWGSGSEAGIAALRRAWQHVSTEFRGMADQRMLEMCQHVAEQVEDAEPGSENHAYRSAMAQLVEDVHAQRTAQQARLDDARQRGQMHMQQDFTIASRRHEAQECRYHECVERYHQLMERNPRFLHVSDHGDHMREIDYPQPDVPVVGELGEVSPYNEICAIGSIVTEQASGLVYGLRTCSRQYYPDRRAYMVEVEWCCIRDGGHVQVVFWMESSIFHEDRTPLSDEIERRLML